MITREMLQVYEQFGGDSDGWARSSKKVKQPFTDEDWRLIDEILHNLRIVASGLATAEFAAQVNARAMEAALNEDVLERFYHLARSMK